MQLSAADSKILKIFRVKNERTKKIGLNFGGKRN